VLIATHNGWLLQVQVLITAQNGKAAKDAASKFKSIDLKNFSQAKGKLRFSPRVKAVLSASGKQVWA